MMLQMEQNPNCPYISNDLYRILIIKDSRLEKNALFNLIIHQQGIDE